MTLNQQVRKLKGNIIVLPYESRESARVLVDKWETHKRLSQLEQLRVDQLLALVAATKEKQHGTSNKV